MRRKKPILPILLGLFLVVSNGAGSLDAPVPSAGPAMPDPFVPAVTLPVPIDAQGPVHGAVTI